MILGTTFYLDFITSNPSTGGVTDADFLPTVAVFEDDNDTSIYSPTVAKRVAHDGNYRITMVATEANGFEAGRSYAVIASATVGGVLGKTVVSNFIMSDMNTLTQVASAIDPGIPSESFIPVITDVAPIDPGPIEDIYPAGSDYANYIERFYDKASNAWTDGVNNVVPAEVRAAVLNRINALVLYQSALADYNMEYEVQRNVQWRKKVAQDIIEACG